MVLRGGEGKGWLLPGRPGLPANLWVTLFDQANAPTGDDGDAMIEALSSAIADHPSLLCADGAPFRHIFAVQDCAGTARTAAGTEPHLHWVCALWHAAPADGDDTERASLRLKCAAAGLLWLRPGCAGFGGCACGPRG